MPDHSSDATRADRLASLLRDARTSGEALASVPDDLMPRDAAEADACQFAVVDSLGAIGAFKVMQVGDAAGSLGPIPARHVLTAPCSLALPSSRIRIELELAFRIGRDLPGRADGHPYGRNEVAEAIASALPVFEIVESRLPAGLSGLIGRADSMSNWGLALGTEISDWRTQVRSDLTVRLTIAGRTVVDSVGGHPSGDPAHALPWLANALVAAGRPLAAGQIVTTGAFGGAHPVEAGDTVEGAIGDFDPIAMRFTAA